MENFLDIIKAITPLCIGFFGFGTFGRVILKKWNTSGRAFKWTKSSDEILTKIHKAADPPF